MTSVAVYSSRLPGSKANHLSGQSAHHDDPLRVGLLVESFSSPCSGSTVPYIVDRIIQQGPERNKDGIFIPTGFRSKKLILSARFNLGDVAIDGLTLSSIVSKAAVQKGPGGGRQNMGIRHDVTMFSLTISRTQSFIVVADRKNSTYLGKNFAQGVPIEVVPFAYTKVLHTLHHDIGSPNAALRMAKAKAGPSVTDNGNFVIDAPFSRDVMQDPYLLLAKLKMLTGVVEVGLFCKIAHAAYFGNEDGSVMVKRAESDKMFEEHIAAP